MDDGQLAAMRPRREQQRLENQERLALVADVLADGSLLGGALDLLTDAIVSALEVPAALVSLVGSKRQHFAGQTGMAPGATAGTPISYSFCQHVVSRGEPLVIDDATEEELVCDNPAIADLGVLAYAGQPIIVHGQVLGSVAAIDTAPRHWVERDVAALRAFADVVQYLVNARLSTQGQLRDQREGARARDRQQAARLAVYEARANEQTEVLSLNRRLQSALLARPGSPGGRRADVFYESGSNRMLLGGDFADTVLDEAGTLHFVIGDVTGHGPEAAALAIGLRSGWHALQAVGTDLAQILAVLDRQTADAGLYATLLIGSVGADGDLQLASAGHPPPIAVGEQRAVELPTRPGPMLGLKLDAPVWHPVTHALADDTLLAYTDGLIEGIMHPSRERFGIERLLSAIQASGPQPGLLCREATAANGGPLPDDVAILLIYPA